MQAVLIEYDRIGRGHRWCLCAEYELDRAIAFFFFFFVFPFFVPWELSAPSGLGGRAISVQQPSDTGLQPRSLMRVKCRKQLRFRISGKRGPPYRHRPQFSKAVMRGRTLGANSHQECISVKHEGRKTGHHQAALSILRCGYAVERRQRRAGRLLSRIRIWASWRGKYWTEPRHPCLLTAG